MAVRRVVFLFYPFRGVLVFLEEVSGDMDERLFFLDVLMTRPLFVTIGILKKRRRKRKGVEKVENVNEVVKMEVVF